jgi:hypothetical protein
MLLQILFFSVTMTAAQIPQPSRTQIKVMYNERECDSGGTIPVCGPGTQWVDAECVPCIPPTISALGIATSASADYDDNQYNIDWINKLLSVTSKYAKATYAATNAYTASIAATYADTGTADAASAKLNAAYDAGKAVSDKAGWYAIAAAAVYTRANICIV